MSICLSAVSQTGSILSFRYLRLVATKERAFRGGVVISTFMLNIRIEEVDSLYRATLVCDL